MATQAQILANRQNAQKSTGPKTAEGKATSAQNATKHGLFAQDPVLSLSNGNVVIPENQAQFDALRDEMLADLAPAGAMEAILAERIVSLTWRLKRAARMQDEVIDVKIRSEINSSRPLLSKSLITGQWRQPSLAGPCRLSRNTKRCYDDLALGLVTKWDFAGDRVLERLSMYERRFEASLFKTMAELKKLQVARKRDQAETAETQAASYRGRDVAQAIPGGARETQGRDVAQAIPGGTLATECAKQSQFAESQEGLTPFKKREYELLIGTPSRSNKANDPQPKAGFRDPKTENRPQRKAGVCRY